MRMDFWAPAACTILSKSEYKPKGHVCVWAEGELGTARGLFRQPWFVRAQRKVTLVTAMTDLTEGRQIWSWSWLIILDCTRMEEKNDPQAWNRVLWNWTRAGETMLHFLQFPYNSLPLPLMLHFYFTNKTPSSELDRTWPSWIRVDLDLNDFLKAWIMQCVKICCDIFTHSDKTNGSQNDTTSMRQHEDGAALQASTLL